MAIPKRAPYEHSDCGLVLICSGQGLLNLDRLALGDKRVFPIRLFILIRQRDLSRWAPVSNRMTRMTGQKHRTITLASPQLAGLVAFDCAVKNREWAEMAINCAALPTVRVLSCKSRCNCCAGATSLLGDCLIPLRWDGIISTASNMGPYLIQEDHPGK